MPIMRLPIMFLLIAVVAAAGAIDFRCRRIPNWLNVLGVVLGLVTNTTLFHSNGLASSVLGLSLALLVYMPLYLLRGMGAGDVKLMAAVGAIAGPQNWLYIFLLTCILGGLLALIMVVLRGRLYVTLLNLGSILSDLSRLRRPHTNHPELDVRHKGSLSLPHGVSIALGSIAFLVLTRAL